MIKYRIETQDKNGDWKHIALSRLPPSYFQYLDMVIEEAEYWTNRLNVTHRVTDESGVVIYPAHDEIESK